MTLVSIKIGKRIYNVNHFSRNGNRTVRAEPGKVFLQREGEPPFLSEWPMRFHAETWWMVCVK